MSFAPRFTTSHPITAALTRIERARGFLDAAKLSEDWIRRMGERALVLEAHHTTHIEGTRLTLEQSERLWAGEQVPEADPDDVRELLGTDKPPPIPCRKTTWVNLRQSRDTTRDTDAASPREAP